MKTILIYLTVIPFHLQLSVADFFCHIFSTILLLYSENLNSVTLAIAAIFLLSKKAGLFSKHTPSGSWCIQK